MEPLAPTAPLELVWQTLRTVRNRSALASEVAPHPLPIAAVARVAPPAAAVAAFVQKHPAAALPGADLDPAELRGGQELRRGSRHGPQGAIQLRPAVVPAPVPAPTVSATGGHYA